MTVTLVACTAFSFLVCVSVSGTISTHTRKLTVVHASKVTAKSITACATHMGIGEFSDSVVLVAEDNLYAEKINAVKSIQMGSTASGTWPIISFAACSTPYR